MTSSRKIRHHSADYWQEKINQWRASGLKQTEFCQQNNLAISTFHKWQKKLRNETQQDSTLPTPFIELACEPTHSIEPEKQWTIELSLGHGIILRLRPS